MLDKINMSIPPQPPTVAPPKPHINTRIAHNVNLWMRESIASGSLKKCWNLEIDKVELTTIENGKTVDAGESYFVPVCRKNSLLSNISHLDDKMQIDVLRHSLSNSSIECPKHCTYYRNFKWTSSKYKILNMFRSIMVFIKKLLRVFTSLAWQTQVALILLIVLIISPKWAPVIISVAKAIWGK